MPDITPTTFQNSVQVPQYQQTGLAQPTTSSTSGTPSTGNAVSMLGKDDFMKLLLAQLQNQDPMKPMDDSQTIAQMAQFSALEATQNLSSVLQTGMNQMSLMNASSLIGKYIQAANSDGSTTTGAVTGVDFTTTNGAVTPELVVNGQDVDYSTVVKLSSTAIDPTSTDTSSSSGSSGSSSTSPTTPSSAPPASTSTTTTTTTTSPTTSATGATSAATSSATH
jgi:flagellar basal-body rod modification protein FlgD